MKLTKTVYRKRGKMIIKVKKLRENANMTQEEMAEQLGLSSANAYSLKEREERRFSLEKARVIAKFFRLLY
ncbi:helix-turn-helix transcriptional regulator [Acetobacterium tundrae]|uniref:Helix-turn-helix domain-containing protein n=1 Tax=Acetobacterium tundrae TaxID=132932 RepID=A0ABR6WQ99_9FIRM|nr:helix-turn-helix transcriptional regulator [Acetobacterium tundrae]MBC3798648.1 helix-turn-helix domain-containing protein [Acetobacterium tundrae]